MTKRARKPRITPKSGPRRKTPRKKPAANVWPAFEKKTIQVKTDVTPTIGEIVGKRADEPTKLTRIAKTVRWPANWWEAVRERFAPQWWLDRYPVDYTEQSYWEETTDQGTDSPVFDSKIVRTSGLLAQKAETTYPSLTFTTAVDMKGGDTVTIEGVPQIVAGDSVSLPDSMAAGIGFADDVVLNYTDTPEKMQAEAKRILEDQSTKSSVSEPVAAPVYRGRRW